MTIFGELQLTGRSGDVDGGSEWVSVICRVMLHKYRYSKWFEPRSISSLSCVRVRVRVVLIKTVV